MIMVILMIIGIIITIQDVYGTNGAMIGKKTLKTQFRQGLRGPVYENIQFKGLNIVD